MSTRDVFSEQELARLRGFPEITSEELIRFFTLSSEDEAFVRSMRRAATMLGVAVQLCSLTWLGFVPDDVAAAPWAAVTRLAERLGLAAGELVGYGGSGTDSHRSPAAGAVGGPPAGTSRPQVRWPRCVAPAAGLAR